MSTDEKCSRCGHAWSDHTPGRYSGKCIHRIAYGTPWPGDWCGCLNETPKDREQGRRAAAMWNAHLGRTS